MNAPHNPNSPIGQVESFGALASGLTRLRGWRRSVARWFVFAAIALPLVIVVVVQVAR